MATGVDRGGATVAASEVRTDDWPVQATDAIVSVVGKAHSSITGPIQKAGRVIVWGLFAAVLGITALVLFVILAIRLVDVYLPSSLFGDRHVWAAYLVVGLLFSAAGLVGLRLARKPAATD